MPSESTDKPVSLRSELVAETRPRKTHPKGWEPGVAWNGDQGTLTTAPMDGEPAAGIWLELIADWGLDPTTTEVVEGSVQVRAWDTHDGRRLRYYRATIQRTSSTNDSADIEALCRLVEKRRPVKSATTDAPRGILCCLSDWQLGKGEGGGTPATVERILRAADELVARVKEVSKAGRPPATIYLVGLGDLVEQCSGHYPSQAFTTDLDRRSQMRLARRLILHYVDSVLSLAPRIVLAAVPGNHVENRNSSGKAYTTATDNDDLAVFEGVAEILAANPDRYGHVHTVLAEAPTLVLDIAGVPVAFAHGHKANGGGHPAAKLEGWWKGQVMGRQPVADAAILITGHFHHLIVSETTGRTFMQVPAMDGGSEWWTDQTGQNSAAGTLCLGIGEGYGARGWGDLVVLAN